MRAQKAVWALAALALLAALLPARVAGGAPYTSNDGLLERLLLAGNRDTGMTLERFFAEYFEKREYIVRRGNASHYESLFGSDRLDAVLMGARLRYVDDVKVLRDGVTLLTGEDGPVNANAVAQAYAAGATFAINSLHERDPAVRQLAHEAELAFFSFANVNVYLTPPDAVGLIPHFDIRDVFVIQIEGSKEWRVWEPQDELPIDKEEIRDAATRLAPAAARVFTLHAGDLMYMPRGIIHQPRTPANEHSLHVTLGVDPVRWEDALQMAVNAVLGDDRRNDEPLVRSAGPESITWRQLVNSLLHSLALSDVSLRRGVRVGRLAALARQPALAEQYAAERQAHARELAAHCEALADFMRATPLESLGTQLGWAGRPRSLAALQKRYDDLAALIAAYDDWDAALSRLQQAVVRAHTVPARGRVYWAISCLRMPSCFAQARVRMRPLLFSLDRQRRELWIGGRASALALPGSGCFDVVARLAAGESVDAGALSAELRSHCLALLISNGFAVLDDTPEPAREAVCSAATEACST